MQCVITHIHKYAKNRSYSDNSKQVNNLIKTIFHGVPEDEMDVNQDIFGLSTLTLITGMVHLMGINLYGKSKTLEMVTVICGIKNIHFLAPRFLVLFHVESHKRFLVLVQQNVTGVI